MSTNYTHLRKPQSITISESDKSVNFAVVSVGPLPPRPAAFSNFVTGILQLTLLIIVGYVLLSYEQAKHFLPMAVNVLGFLDSICITVFMSLCDIVGISDRLAEVV